MRYSRDIGRSSRIGGFHVYQFGDTFSTTREGDFLGNTDNTCAVVPEPSQQPTSCVYHTFEPDGRVSALVPCTNDERFPGLDRYTKLWSFGGILEDPLLDGYGWVFFEKNEWVSLPVPWDVSQSSGGRMKLSDRPDWSSYEALRNGSSTGQY